MKECIAWVLLYYIGMKRPKTHTLDSTLPYILVVGGFVGLVASFVLTMEKIALLKDPAHQLSCSLNPVLSCGSIIASPEASAFHFPNPFIGLAGFAVVITVGMGIIAGATYKRWFWRGLELGTVFGIGFVHWLFYQSLYDVGALCIYCMMVWSITWPIFWYTTLYNLRHGNIPTPKLLTSAVAFAQRYHVEILITWYLLIFIAIMHRFWYYWQTVI